MKKATSTLLMFVAVAVGLGGATFAYRATASTDPAVSSSSRVVWAPCPEGTQLEGDICVKQKVRTVVVTVPPPDAAAQVGNDDGDDDDHDDSDEDDGDDDSDDSDDDDSDDDD